MEKQITKACIYRQSSHHAAFQTHREQAAAFLIVKSSSSFQQVAIQHGLSRISSSRSIHSMQHQQKAHSSIAKAVALAKQPGVQG